VTLYTESIVIYVSEKGLLRSVGCVWIFDRKRFEKDTKISKLTLREQIERGEKVWKVLSHM